MAGIVPMVPRLGFDDLYPRAQDNDEPVPGIIKGGRWEPCWVCARPTRWISVSFEAHVCSAVCDQLGWDRFWAADGGRRAP
jgi:hypothetical protein